MYKQVSSKNYKEKSKLEENARICIPGVEGEKEAQLWPADTERICLSVPPGGGHNKTMLRRPRRQPAYSGTARHSSAR